MIKTLEQINEQINELYPYSINYQRQVALDIIYELEMRMISPFDFLDKMLNAQFPHFYTNLTSEETESENHLCDNSLNNCRCLKNKEV